jgi:hypothetical protein
MGCQREIVKPIVAGGGDCVIAVRDNQPKLLEAIQTPSFDHREGDRKDLKPRHHETHEAGHGRIDDRYDDLAEVPPDLACREEWPWVKAIGDTVRITRPADGTETDEVRDSLSRRSLSGRRFAEAVRGHRGIESMHWVLDVNLGEDESRTRERTPGDNLSWMRRFAVTLPERHPDEDSLRGKMMSCRLSTDYRTQVLSLHYSMFNRRWLWPPGWL